MKIEKNKVKILIVDDDMRFVDKTYSILSSLGYDVSACFSAMEARNLIIQRPFHILLLDCLMPEMDGYSLARFVQKHFGSSISVIFMSAVFQKNDMLFTDLYNVSAMLKKPFSISQIESELIKTEKKVFTKEKNQNLPSILFSDYSHKEIHDFFKSFSSAREGDVFLLFFYFLYSEFKGSLKLYDHMRSVEISFMDKCVVNITEDNNDHLIKYLLKNNLLNQTECLPFKNLEQKQVFEKLMNGSLISPHHLTVYNIEYLMDVLKDFSKKPSFKFELKELKHSSIKIHHLQVINTITEIMPGCLSETYLKWFIGQVEKSDILINEEKRNMWGNRNLKILKPIYNQLNELKSDMSLHLFLSLFSSNKQGVYKSVFWLFSQNFITFKRAEHLNLQKTYAIYYEKLLNFFSSLQYQEIFQYLGCQNYRDENSLKKVFRQYFKYNHIDNFSEYENNLKSTINKVNQIVTMAYDTLINDEKWKSYKELQNTKKIKKNVEFSKIKSKIPDCMKNLQYNQALKHINRLEDLKCATPFEKQEITLWKIVIEVKKSSELLSQDDLNKINHKMDSIHESEVLSSVLYLYTMGVLSLCNSDISSAKIYLDQAIKTDDTFHLARLERLNIGQFKKISLK